MGDVAKYRGTTQENLVEILKALIATLVSRAGGAKLVGSVRDILKALVLSKTKLDVPATLVQDLYVAVFE